jgi:hypothetical protein
MDYSTLLVNVLGLVNYLCRLYWYIISQFDDATAQSKSQMRHKRSQLLRNKLTEMSQVFPCNLNPKS